MWPAWVKMLPCVPHSSLGRSLRAGGEEPDSQALCVLPGPCADSPGPRAPRQVPSGHLDPTCTRAWQQRASQASAGMAVQTVCARLRAHLVRGQEAGPEGHVTPCQSELCSVAGGGKGGGDRCARNKGGDSSKDEAARAAGANAKAYKVPGAEGRLLGATRNEVTAGEWPGAGGAGGRTCPRDAAGLGGRAHAGLGSLPRSLPGGRALRMRGSRR